MIEVMFYYVTILFPSSDPVYTQSATQLPSILYVCPDECDCVVAGNTSVPVDSLGLHCVILSCLPMCCLG